MQEIPPGKRGGELGPACRCASPGPRTAEQKQRGHSRAHTTRPHHPDTKARHHEKGKLQTSIPLGCKYPQRNRSYTPGPGGTYPGHGSTPAFVLCPLNRPKRTTTQRKSSSNKTQYPFTIRISGTKVRTEVNRVNFKKNVHRKTPKLTSYPW